MDYKTHVVVGTSTAIGISLAARKYGVNIPVTGIGYVASAAFGSLLPDIDHPKSFLGNCIPEECHFIRHRTVTHGILFLAIVTILISFFSAPCGFGAFIGILSHIILDMIDNKGHGVCIMAPINYKRYKL